MDYTDDEIQKKWNEVNAACATLKRSDHIRLTFFDGARDEYGTTFAKNYDGYFNSYGKSYGTVSITPKIESGFFQSPPDTYPLKYIEEIAVIKGPGEEAK